MVRSFIALELSPELRENLRELIEDLKRGAKFTGARPNWVRPESIHLTLKFLGNIGEEMIEPIGNSIKEIAAGTDPFTLRALGLGVFPHERRPRVFWCGLSKGEKQIISVQRKVDAAMLDFGFEKEKRPFHPHLTLARMKSMKGADALMKMLRNHKNRRVGECPIDKLVLYKSQLHPQGAIYTKLVEAPFAEIEQES